jgi:hypothetical protein
VQLVGGRIETISAPGSGTEIRATFPLSTENGDVYSEESI